MEKNKTLLKICGIRSVEEMEELKGLDIDYIGCIFAKSPRQVNIEVASQITKIAHKNGKKVVGVFVNTMIRDIVRIVETLRLMLCSFTEMKRQNIVKSWEKRLKEFIKII